MLTERELSEFCTEISQGSVDARKKLLEYFENKTTSTPERIIDAHKSFVYCFFNRIKDKNQYDENFLGICFLYGFGVKENAVAALEWFQAAASKNNANAQFYLGYMCHFGLGGMKRDYKIAKKWFEKALHQDDSQAIDMLEKNISIYRIKPKFVEISAPTLVLQLHAQQPRKIEYIEEVSSSDDSDELSSSFRNTMSLQEAQTEDERRRVSATSTTSKLIDDAILVNGNEKRLSKGSNVVAAQTAPKSMLLSTLELEKYLEYICQGSGEAREQLENYWFNIEELFGNNSAHPDYERFQLQKKSIFEYASNRLKQEKNHYLEELLGFSYYRCFKGGLNYEEAVKLLQKAAKKNNPYAQCGLGLAYEEGNGVKKDYKKAVEWYQKAAAQNNAVAIYRLGRAYHGGCGVKLEKITAVQCYISAAQLGNVEAQVILAIEYSTGVTIKQDNAKAFEWYHRAAEKNYEPAQYALGLCYENGTGVTKSVDQAIYWYLRSAERAAQRYQGNANAKVKLGQLKAKGFGAMIAKQELLIAEEKKQKSSEANELHQEEPRFIEDLDSESGEKDSSTGTANSSKIVQNQLTTPRSHKTSASVSKHLAKVLYSFKASNENELSINKDDQVLILEERSEWCLGELNGQRGWLPSNYLLFLKPDEVRVPPLITTASTTASTASQVTPAVSASVPFSIQNYHDAIAQTAEKVRQGFLFSLQSEYQKLFAEYQQLGQQKLEDQLQAQQEGFSDYLARQQQILQGQAVQQQAQFSQALQKVLRQYSSQDMSAFSEAALQQVKLQVQENLGKNFVSDMEKLLNSQSYQTEIQRLQQAILKRIEERQGQLGMSMIHVQQKQKQMQNEHDPMYQRHQQYQQTLVEQRALQDNGSVCMFYNTIEKVLGSRLMSAMSLASGMLKRESTKSEERIETGVNIAGKIIELVPVIGPIANAVISTGLEIGQGLHGIHKDKKQGQKYTNTLDSMIRLEDALALAELVARRLAQSYEQHITQNYLTVEEAAAAGENAADIVYGCIKSGGLLALATKSVDEKVMHLVSIVQEEAAKRKDSFFRKAKGTVFKEPAIAIASATRTQVQALSKGLTDSQAKSELTTVQTQIGLSQVMKKQAKLEAEIDYLKRSKSSSSTAPASSFFQTENTTVVFSLLAEGTWPAARSQLTQVMPKVFSSRNDVQIQRNQKQLMLSTANSFPNKEKKLEELGDLIYKMFAGDLEDWEVDNNVLLIIVKASQNAKKLETFLGQILPAPAMSISTPSRFQQSN